jgi:hypothetical protein
MFILENASLVGSIIVYPHTAAIPAGTKTKSISFLATATDKTNNPYCYYTFTPTAQENLMLITLGQIENKRFLHIYSIFNGKSIYKS